MPYREAQSGKPFRRALPAARPATALAKFSGGSRRIENTA